jgi:hypothetical protein
VTKRYLVELVEVLEAAGLNVIAVDGWETRARGSGGYDGDRPWAILWHHTASQTTPENDVGYICYGCPDAPVANLYLARTGEVWVCAAGATNTNGKGGPYTTSRGVVPVDQMNTHAVSIEAANAGTGETWPQVQIDAYFTIANALAAAYGLDPALDNVSHAAWTPGRKIDPAVAAAVQGPWQPASSTTAGTWALTDIQHEAARRASSTPPPHPPEEDEMYLAFLNDGTVVVVGSAVRPVSSDEIAPGGPLASLRRETPPPESYWHMWLAAGAAEYSARVGPI